MHYANFLIVPRYIRFFEVITTFDNSYSIPRMFYHITKGFFLNSSRETLKLLSARALFRN
jgi:hypothetical protein